MRSGAAARRSPVARAWLVSRLGLGFGYYLVGAWVLGALVLPVQRLAGRVARAVGLPTAAPDLRAQRTIHAASRSFLWVAGALGFVQVEWRGDASLGRGPALLVANHPSLIDTPILAARLPQVDFIVSPEWGTNPLLRGAVAGAGYLRADRGAAAVQEAADRLRAGRTVAIYPEGTRTPPEGLGRFQRGAAHVALEAGCDLVPVRIRMTPRALMKGQSWTDYPDDCCPRWTVEVGAPIRPSEHLEGSEPRSLAARRLTGILHDWFESRGSRGEP